MITLIEDSTTELVSPQLYNLVEKVILQDSEDSLQKDLFYVLIIVLMLENGFYPLGICLSKTNSATSTSCIQLLEPENVTNQIDLPMLKSWKTSSGMFETKFILNGYKNLHLKLLMSPVAAAVLVNVVIEELNSETYSVCLPISRYVVSPTASSIPMIFRDLKHLSTTFKNKVLVPVKSRILSHCGYPSASLTGLPDELILKIVSYLPIASVVNLYKTCTRLRNLVDVNTTWHELFLRDFIVVVTASEKWKEAYVKQYKLVLEDKLKSQQRRSGALHDHMDYSDFISYIDNPMWDVFI